MKTIITILLAVITATAFAQTPKTDMLKHRMQVGYFYSFDYTDRIYDDWQNNFSTDITKGFATGLNFSKRFRKRWAADVGLLHTNRGETRNNLLSIDSSGHYRRWDLLYTFRFIEVPLKLKYYFIQTKRINIYALAGLSANYYINTKRVIVDYSSAGLVTNKYEKVYKDPSFTTIILGGGFGFGMEYKLNKRWNMSLSTESKSSWVIPPSNYPGYNSHLNATGLNLGLCYNF